MFRLIVFLYFVCLLRVLIEFIYLYISEIEKNIFSNLYGIHSFLEETINYRMRELGTSDVAPADIKSGILEYLKRRVERTKIQNIATENVTERMIGA